MIAEKRIPLSGVKWLAMLAGSVSLVACDSGSDGTVAPGVPPIQLTGTFIDSPVENIGYRTESIASGATDSQGRFNYLAGESVTFFIGNLDFPSTQAQEVVTPFDLAGTTDITDPTVINIARLLQSLDENGNPDDGIRIPDIAVQAATQIDFTQIGVDFEADVLTFIANAGSVNVSLVDEAVAVEHLTESVLTNELGASTSIGVGVCGTGPGSVAPFYPCYVIVAFHEDLSLLEVWSDDSSTGVDPDDPELGYVPQRQTGTWSLVGDSMTIARGQDIETFDITIVEDSLLYDVDGDGQPDFTDTIAKRVDVEQLLGRYNDSLCIDCFVTFLEGNVGTRESTGGNVAEFIWAFTENGDLTTTSGNDLVEYYFLSITGGVLEYVSYENSGAANNPKMRTGTLTKVDPTTG